MAAALLARVGKPPGRSPELVALGKRTYGIYCTACHGVAGAGDGTVPARLRRRRQAPTSSSERPLGMSVSFEPIIAAHRTLSVHRKRCGRMPSFLFRLHAPDRSP